MCHLPFRLVCLLNVSSSNGRQAVGDGAKVFDHDSSVMAVCQVQGNDDMYYYSTTFSGGPGVSGIDFIPCFCPDIVGFTVAFLTPPRQNALLTEGRRTV